MSELEKNGLNTEAVDVEVGTAEDVDAIMKKYDRESNTRVWTGKYAVALRWLTALFGIKSLLLEGGGITALGFAKADLIDEVSFLMAPIMGEPDAMGLFGPDNENMPYAPGFAHREVLAAPGGAMWVRQWK